MNKKAFIDLDEIDPIAAGLAVMGAFITYIIASGDIYKRFSFLPGAAEFQGSGFFISIFGAIFALIVGYFFALYLINK